MIDQMIAKFKNLQQISRRIRDDRDTPFTEYHYQRGVIEGMEYAIDIAQQQQKGMTSKRDVRVIVQIGGVEYKDFVISATFPIEPKIGAFIAQEISNKTWKIIGKCSRLVYQVRFNVTANDMGWTGGNEVIVPKGTRCRITDEGDEDDPMCDVWCTWLDIELKGDVNKLGMWLPRDWLERES